MLHIGMLIRNCVWHRELHAHDDVDRPSPSVQVLDTKWVFDLKINTTTRMVERFKTSIVANGQPQILGFV